MNFLVLGAGGREHAFAWKLAQSPLCENLYIAPGNGGTDSVGINVSIAVTDFETIASFCLEKNVTIVVVGPEAPLVEGIYDFFNENERLKNIAIIGPSKYGAQLEGSKSFAKEFMLRHDIPTAAYQEFTIENLNDGFDFIDKNAAPFVLKADGLAAGKGVVITESREEAKETLREMIAEAKFGDASAKVLIEQFLDGIEFSVFALTDGKNYVLLPEAKDYKRIGEGDKGLNTGGMGAVSPVPFVDKKLMEIVDEQIVKPTIDGFQKENIAYKGFVFFGLILVKGEPFVIEYNCRMGDPETEVVLPRLSSDLAELFVLCAENRLNEATINHDNRAAATVVLASGGYPEKYERGKTIDLPTVDENTIVFHAGTKQENNLLKTNGGRVMMVTSYAENIKKAAGNSSETAEKIDFDGKYYRKDIGYEF
ncbi:MAG: phosphoribosylamine--glycine ligase [Chitinophagales bacterium]